MTGVQVLAVADADADQRLDRWFRRLSRISRKAALKRCAVKVKSVSMVGA